MAQILEPQPKKNLSKQKEKRWPLGLSLVAAVAASLLLWWLIYVLSQRVEGIFS